MTIYDNIFPLGIGTSRLPIENEKDMSGIEKSAQLILAALERGCSYVDTAYLYSRAMAETACGLAFKQTNKPINVTAKVSFSQDKTADDALRRIERSLNTMNIPKATYFMAWGIMSYTEFVEMSKKGAMLDGAIEAKKRGLVDHICFSTHAPIDDIIKILDSKIFEGVTIAMSALNSTVVVPAIEAAKRNNVGVAVMNPLAGGVIPQNRNYFSFLSRNKNENTIQAALRFVKAHEGIQIVLSGMNSMEELDENSRAFDEPDTEAPHKRVARVVAKVNELEGFCTGCRYCSGCPANIPIHAYMQGHNAALFPPTPAYKRGDAELLRDIQMFRKLKLDFSLYPQTPENPCIKCGKCEEKCTQHLPIIRILDEMHSKMKLRGYYAGYFAERFTELIKNHNYKKIAFYPAGGYINQILNFNNHLFGNYNADFFAFDSNSLLWNTQINGMQIYSPDMIETLKPEVILIGNYIYQEEIYEKIKCFEKGGITIVKLHRESDVPIVF